MLVKTKCDAVVKECLLLKIMQMINRHMKWINFALESDLVYTSTEIKAELGQTRNRYLIIFNVTINSPPKSLVFSLHKKARAQTGVLKG